MVTGPPATLTTAVSAESWQFFAFVFAALVTFFFGALDSLLIGIGTAWCWGCTILTSPPPMDPDVEERATRSLSPVR
jgi:hypothetical protein